MVGKNNNIQTGTTVNTEKSESEQQRSGQQRSEQPQRNRSNYQRYNQGQKSQNQSRTQNSTQSPDAQSVANKDPKGQGQKATQNSHFQSGPRNNNRGARTNETQPRENGQQRGYYRDRVRDNDRDPQPRQHSASGRYGNITKNRVEETIDDIKLDIIRLEKEIDLEIMEIRSLKL